MDSVGRRWGPTTATGVSASPRPTQTVMNSGVWDTAGTVLNDHLRYAYSDTNNFNSDGAYSVDDVDDSGRCGCARGRDTHSLRPRNLHLRLQDGRIYCRIYGGLPDLTSTCSKCISMILPPSYPFT